jgi:hypothetical protein
MLNSIDTETLRQIIQQSVAEAIGDELISAAEASRMLKVNPRTLTRMTQDGEIVARVIGKRTMYARSEVLRAGRVKYQRQ